MIKVRRETDGYLAFAKFKLYLNDKFIGKISEGEIKEIDLENSNPNYLNVKTDTISKRQEIRVSDGDEIVIKKKDWVKYILPLRILGVVLIISVFFDMGRFIYTLGIVGWFILIAIVTDYFLGTIEFEVTYK